MVLNSLKVRVGRLLIMLFTVFFIIGWSPSLLHANVNDEEEEVVSEEEKVALELSDIISFHSYCPYDVLVEQIRYFKKYFGRKRRTI